LRRIEIPAAALRLNLADVLKAEESDVSGGKLNVRSP